MSIATINPYRYSSYYYDSEIELYYLQSRYYDAVVGRFINGDEAEIVIKNNLNNLYEYSSNNVVNYYDPNGKVLLSVSLTALAVKIVAGMAISFAIISIANSKPFRKALGDLYGTVGKITRNATDALVESIDMALTKSKAKAKTQKEENHHIVAKRAKRAQKSRDLLNHKNVKISVEDPRNKVYINYNLHKPLHTNAYHYAVYCLLKKAEGSYKKTVVVLKVIKEALKAASNMCL